MKRRPLSFIAFSIVILCAFCVMVWYQGMPSPTQKAIQKVLDDPATATQVKQQKNLPEGIDQFITWYVPRVQNASPNVQALMKEYDAKFRGAYSQIHMELEEMFPTDEWLQRYLDMGLEISNFSDYSYALSSRWGLFHAKNEADGLLKQIEWYGLPRDASWDDVTNITIRHDIKMYTQIHGAMEKDPAVYGGSLSPEGVFIPFRHKTVYVQRSDSGFSLSGGSGVEDWVKDEIGKQAKGLPSKEIPEDITVIYLDEKGNPIPQTDTEITPPSPPSEDHPTAEREQIGVSTSEDKGAVPTGETEQPPSVTGSSPDRAMPPKPEPLTFDDLPKSDADWERLLSESPLSELENRLSEDGLRELAKTLNQYGIEEGLKRIEAKDPELAE